MCIYHYQHSFVCFSTSWSPVILRLAFQLLGGKKVRRYIYHYLFYATMSHVLTYLLIYLYSKVLYRGFLLPALCIQMKFWPALFVSGIIFSAHHVSTTGAIPLAILGWTWGMVYAKSNNLLVTILIHCMWNSRVFLGSWLGL